MKFVLTSLSAILLCAVFSCTKTGTPVSQTAGNPIVGLWVGTYQSVLPDASDSGINTADSFYYSLDIRANGTVITTAIGPTNNSTSSAGPWQLNGTAFSATLTTLNGGSPLYVQAVTAVYDSTGGTLKGQAIFTQGSGNTSTFLLLRVP